MDDELKRHLTEMERQLTARIEDTESVILGRLHLYEISLAKLIDLLRWGPDKIEKLINQ
jgi:hypothetical protein